MSNLRMKPSQLHVDDHIEWTNRLGHRLHGIVTSITKNVEAIVVDERRANAFFLSDKDADRLAIAVKRRAPVKP